MPAPSANVAKEGGTTNGTSARVDEKATSASVWVDARPTGQTIVRFEPLRRSVALMETAAWVATASSVNARASTMRSTSPIPTSSAASHLPWAQFVDTTQQGQHDEQHANAVRKRKKTQWWTTVKKTRKTSPEKDESQTIDG